MDTSIKLDGAPTNWFSMEIQTFVVTTTGREIHISKLTNVLSFLCVCPICEERFTDEVTLKLHCRKDHLIQTCNVDKNEEFSDSMLTVGSGSRIVPTKVDHSTQETDKVPIEMSDVNPANMERHNIDFSADNSSLGDNGSSSSEADIDDLEAANGTIKPDFKGDKGTSQVDKSSRDLDDIADDSIVIDAAAEKPYKCADCGRAYSKKYNLNVHRRIHQGHVFKCDKCEKQLLSATSLKAHNKIHTKERPYQCTKCDRGFLRKTSLAKHDMDHKIESLISQYKNSREPSIETTQIIPVKGKAATNCVCEMCGLVLSRRQKYVEHMLKHKGVKPYICAVCGEAYRVKSLLTAHYRLHLGEEECKCEECGKEFSSAATLKAHKTTHSGERPFMCSVCGKTFTKRSDLNVHIRRHTKDFAYSCQDCAKTFATKWALKSHRWSHTGEKPYLCPTCGKGFTGQSRLKEHIRIHTGEKPYVCNICGKAFNQKHSLKDHVTIHGDNPEILCSFCGKSCNHKSALNAHIRTVHREKV